MNKDMSRLKSGSASGKKNYESKLKVWGNKPFIKQLIRAFPKAEVFLVGGIVRDSILGHQTKDVDLVVRNISKKNLEKFLNKHGKVSLVGKKFGVFKFVPKGWKDGDIDIALPRTEHSINMTGAYKDFKINSNAKLSIEDDLSRRDFTINAMAFDILNEKLIDPFNGLSDIKKKSIKTVGSAEKRFKEDYSRMLRAIRFACQLNFKIETKTWTAVKKLAKNINKKSDGKQIVPNEVIAKELIKAINQNPTLAIELMDDSGMIKVLMPELLKMKKCPQPKKWHSEGDVWVHTLLSLKCLNDKKFATEFKKVPTTPEVIMGLIFHDLGKPYTITRGKKIKFYGHDVAGAKKFRTIAKRLKLAAGGLNIEKTEKIITKHMILANPRLDEMKDTTIEKYFFNDLFPGQELLMLMFCDITATIPTKGKANFTNYKILKARIKKLNKKSAGKKRLVAPLMNGHDIMKALKLEPGPKIGELLSLTREAQLAGKIKSKAQGIKLLKKYK